MLTPSVVALPSFSCRGAFLKAWAPKRLNGHASQLQRGPNRSVATNWIKDSQWLNATSPKVVGAAERQVFVEKIESLRRGILASNWGDSFQFVLVRRRTYNRSITHPVQNVPFWEAIFEGLHTEVRSVPNLLHDADVARNWVSMSTLMDFMFVCEDLRDHLNELIEFLDRTNSRGEFSVIDDPSVNFLF